MVLAHCTPCSVDWSTHALERKEQRHIELDPQKVSLNHVLSLPFYTNAGCYHYCDSKAGVTYYVPLAPSLDNNTVEIGVEQARYGRAVADYQASLQFMENKIAGLRRAFKGD